MAVGEIIVASLFFEIRFGKYARMSVLLVLAPFDLLPLCFDLAWPFLIMNCF